MAGMWWGGGGGGWWGLCWEGLWPLAVCWATAVSVAGVCCKKAPLGSRGRQPTEGRRSSGTAETQLQTSAREEAVRPPQPETPAQAARSREIRAGRQAKRKDPAYKTLAEVRSDWSDSAASASGPRLEPHPDEGDPVAAAIRAGKRLRRRDPDGDSFKGIPSDWDSSAAKEPSPAGTRETDAHAQPSPAAAAKPQPPKPSPTAHTNPAPGPARDPHDVHSDFLT